MDLFDRLGPRSGLDGCEKLSASTYIELLGLVNSSPGVARPTFDASEVTEFYRETQEVVVATASGSTRADILSELRDGKLFQDEAEELLREYGPRIWGDERGHLIDASVEATDLYPKDLYFNRGDDYTRIEFYVRCWMAKRALRKASEAPKGANAGTPKKRKRNSTSASASKKIGPRKSATVDDVTTIANASANADATVPAGSARKRPARASAIHYAEADDEEEEDEEEEEVDEDDEAGAGAEETHLWREPSVASDHLTPVSRQTSWKKQPRRSEQAEDRSRSSSAARPSKVVKLSVDRNKLTVFEAWHGWRESEARSKRQSTANSDTLPAVPSFPPNPFTVASTPPAISSIVDVPKQYISQNDSEQTVPETTDTRQPQVKTVEETSANDFVSPAPTGFQPINRKPTIEQTIERPPPQPPVERPPPPPDPQPPSQPSRSNSEQTSPTFPPPQTPLAPPPTELSTTSLDITPRDADLKRRQIFSILISLLKSPVPSKIAITSLEPLIDTLWTDTENNRIASLLPDLPKLTKAFTSWIAMHEALENLRDRTKYYGRAGDEWQKYRRSLGFLERVPMMEAMNELGQWRLKQMAEGAWFDEGTFDRDLAAFLDGVMQIPGVGAEDLEDGFAVYNRELLAWFL